MGLIVTIAAILLNAINYSLSTGWNQCHLDGLSAVSVTHRLLQCTRSMGRYFHVGSILVISLLSLHLIFVLGSFLWIYISIGCSGRHFEIENQWRVGAR